ncbi:MAG TPA: hypothetical protein V6D17_05815 [Candidatus Obscuribacterales bacterium]
MTLLGKKRARNFILACVSALALIQAAQPAHAYYWGSPWSWGYTALWPLRAITYPLLGTPWSYRNPVYATSALLGQTTRLAYRAPGYGANPISAPYFANNQTIASQVVNQPQVPQGPSDQIAYARWLKPTDFADRELLARAPGAPTPFIVPQESVMGKVETPQDELTLSPLQQPSNQTAGAGAQALQQPGVGSRAAGSELMPPSAPPFTPVEHHPGSEHLAAAEHHAVPAHQPVPEHHLGGNKPLAAGFVDLVNNKYGGDITKALKDPEARSWAHAMGVIERKSFSTSHLGTERIQTIERILKDSSLEPVAKLQAVGILLRK